MCINDALRDMKPQRILHCGWPDILAEEGVTDAQNFLAVQIFAVAGNIDLHQPFGIGARCICDKFRQQTIDRHQFAGQRKVTVIDAILVEENIHQTR